MSTPSLSAKDSAPDTGLTLNPIIIAFDAAANNTSDSFIAPTPPWITLTLTSSVIIFQVIVLQLEQNLERLLLLLHLSLLLDLHSFG